MHALFFASLLALAGAAERTAAAELPIFDAHLHYSHDAWDNLPPKDAIAILRKAGLKRALVSSSGDDGTQRLVAEAPDLVLPSLRPYRRRSDVSTWVRDETVIAFLEERLGHSRYVAIGEFHVYGADADLPVPRAHGGAGEAAQAGTARAYGYRRSRAALPPGRRRTHPVGAFGIRAPGAGARHAAQIPEPVVRPRLSQRTRQRRQGARRMARGVHGISRPLHGRHRHLHARALALRRRACAMVARLARGPAAGARRAHRLAQRRCAVRRMDAPPRDEGVGYGRRRAAPRRLLASARRARAASSIAGATRRVESANYEIVFTSRPGTDRDRASTSRSISPCARAAARRHRKRCASTRSCPNIGTA